jgi:hypothetical protein
VLLKCRCWFAAREELIGSHQCSPWYSTRETIWQKAVNVYDEKINASITQLQLQSGKSVGGFVDIKH